MDDRNDLLLTDEGDPSLTRGLRELYAAPSDGAYWDRLETRILSLLAAQRLGIVSLQPSWWSVLGRWAAPGLAAAAVLFVAAGLLLSRENDTELGTTYESVTEPAVVEELPGAVQVVTAPGDASSQREAIFRYVLSH